MTSLLLFAAGAGITVFYVLVRGGLVSPVGITEKTEGPFFLIYRKHRGDYGRVVMKTKQMETEMKAASIPVAAGFAVYLDDPKKTPKADLRSVYGCISDESAVVDFDGASISAKAARFPETAAVVALFPNRNRFSPLIGVFKVYPRLFSRVRRLQANPNPILEIHTPETIRYIVAQDIPPDFFDSL